MADENHQTKRLFIALPVPEAAKDILAAVPHKTTDGQWISRDDFHITLRYLGDVPIRTIPALEESLTQIKRPAFNITVEGLGVFDAHQPAILWAAIPSTRKITALVGAINEKLSSLGFDMPTKPYIPHITLGRLASPHSIKDYIKKNTQHVQSHWKVTNFGLFTSAASEQGQKHYQVERFFNLSDR